MWNTFCREVKRNFALSSLYSVGKYKSAQIPTKQKKQTNKQKKPG